MVANSVRSVSAPEVASPSLADSLLEEIARLKQEIAALKEDRETLKQTVEIMALPLP